MKRMIKLTFNVLALSCLLAFHSKASNTKGETKQAHFTFKTVETTDIVVTGGDVEVIIEGWDKDEVDVTATIEFKGKETDRARKFLNEFEEEVRKRISASNAQIEIKTRIDEPNKVQVGSKYFGVQIGYSEDELKLTYEIKVPLGNNLAVKNSYKDLVVLGEYTGNVKIDHYSGDLDAGSFEDLELKLRYGDAEIGDVGDAVLDLYEQKIDMVSLKTAKGEVKYSTLEIEQAGRLYLETYESRIKFVKADKVDGIFKYGDLEVENEIKSADLDAYELTIDIASAESLTFSKSKYSEMNIDNVGEMLFNESYEDDITIRELGKLNTESKYLDLSVRQLIGSIDMDGYESDVKIYEVGSEATLIDIKGKYNELEMDSNGRPFSLDANIKYGSVDYPVSGIDRKVMIKEGDQLEMKLAPSNNASANLNIILRGYEIDADID